MPVPEERFQLALQVLSYRGEVCWQLGDLRMFAIHNGRCSVCGCSAFRHDLLSLYPPRCRHECPTNIMKARNSSDLAGMTMPQFCNPDSPLRRREGDQRASYVGDKRGEYGHGDSDGSTRGDIS